MKRYYPLLRREAIRLAGPMAIILITLFTYLGNLGQDMAVEGRTFEHYGMYYNNMHPSNLLQPGYFVFAVCFGMALSLVQHFAERSSQSSLYWEMLPYSRWEKMYVKTMCAMVPVAVICVIGYKWMNGIVSANADWIAQINTSMPGLSRIDDLLRTDRIMAHWMFLFAGAFSGYALITCLCQIFGTWWRAALVGSMVFLIAADTCRSGARSYIYWSSVVDGRERWFHVQDARILVPEILVMLIAGAGMLFAAFVLEKKRPFERTGHALYRPQMQGYVVGALVILGILSTAVWSGIHPFIFVFVLAVIVLVTPFDLPKVFRFRR
ncbi:MAG: hypothetical protein E7335_07050 [Clostridiales bacterium]|nr:hypothetical protein [Clostridiales bacterium]